MVKDCSSPVASVCGVIGAPTSAPFLLQALAREAAYRQLLSIPSLSDEVTHFAVVCQNSTTNPTLSAS